MLVYRRRGLKANVGKNKLMILNCRKLVELKEKGWKLDIFGLMFIVFRIIKYFNLYFHRGWEVEESH